MADMIQIRRDTAALWNTTNPILASGEFGYESDTGKLKIGDGTTTWTSLGYFTLLVDGITSTAAELNILDGVTSTTAELNLLDGVTSTTAELNYVDGVTSAVQTQIDTKAPTASPTFTGTATAPTVNASTALQIGGTAVTSTAAELNILDGVTASTAELNKLDALSRGSILYGNASGATTVLTKGTDGQVLKSDGTDISWGEAGGGASVDLTADGAITAGRACKINSDGTVSQIAQTALDIEDLIIAQVDSGDIENISNQYMVPCYDSKRNRFLTVGWNGTLSQHVMSIGLIEGNSIVWQSGVEIGSTWNESAPNHQGKALFYDDVNDRVFYFSGYNKKWAMAIPTESSYSWKDDNNHGGGAWYDTFGNSNPVYNGKMFFVAREGTWTILHGYKYISDSSTSLTTQEMQMTSSYQPDKNVVMAVDTASEEMLMTCNDGMDDAAYDIYLVDISGSSFGNSNKIYQKGLTDSSSDRKDGINCICLGAKKYLLTYKNTNNRIAAQVLTFSGTTPTFHTETELDTGTTLWANRARVLKDGRIFVMWYNVGCFVTIDGSNNVTAGTKRGDTSSLAGWGSDWRNAGLTLYAPGSDVVWSFETEGINGQAICFSTTTADPDTYMGLAQSTVSNSASARLDIISATNAQNSGLTTGKKYYVQRDGTVGLDFTNTYAGMSIAANTMIVKG